MRKDTNNYTKRVRLTTEDLLRSLPWKLCKGFLTKEQIKREEEACSSAKELSLKK